MKFLQSKAYINGEWVTAKRNKTYAVVNPANGRLISTVPDMDKADTAFAIDAANEAFKNWRKTSANERSLLLKKWYHLLIENKKYLAEILTSEQGKPFPEAIAEIKYGASYIEWFAEEARRIYGDIIPAADSAKRIMVMKQAVGVVALITPWNFPHAMIARKIGAALAAGCTVVVKPAEATPLSALAMVCLAEEAGFPKGVINVICSSNPSEIGEELCSNPIVRKISFTGSTPVGKILMEKCAGTVKRLSLELGGNAPFIVFEDADIESAVKGLMQSKYRNAGQTCVCANRIFAHSSIHDQFVELLTEATKKLKMGDGFDEDVNVGPLINQKALLKVQGLVEDAISKGAICHTGGTQGNLGLSFYEPTVLSNVNTAMKIHEEEIFSPIASVFKFESEEEAVRMANQTKHGLAAYFYGKDINRIYRVMEDLEFGMVGINTGLLSSVTAPFGGIKESGFGREGSKYGIDEYLDIKYICIGEIK
ncbi:MAG: NAD-dependent succinate-semialdehyde dehydrogenase [Saprospiraceae bacterium]